MPTITEEDVSANHLQWTGHLPDWVDQEGRPPKCSVCGLGRGFRPSWTVDPHWRKR